MDVLIYLASAAGTPVRLTGDLPEEGVSGGRRTHARVQEMIDLVDAPAADSLDLGNAQSTETFEVTRSHASPGAASLYYDEHPAKVSGRGAVEFVHRNPDGRLVARTRHENCLILCTGGEWDGCRTTMQYTIQWGG